MLHMQVSDHHRHSELQAASERVTTQCGQGVGLLGWEYNLTVQNYIFQSFSLE